MATEYAVLCQSDGTLRSFGTDVDETIQSAKSRDESCGRCSTEDGKHRVVSREVGDWQVLGWNAFLYYKG
ncbi:MAG: hypothetical protein JWO15_3660 [Sphingomonadales bacterium]|nr:hypothetical protein [Sphingomonadales bacterium]